MKRITISNLRKKVDELNAEYGLSKTSACYIDILCAYGGYQVVIRVNKKFDNYCREITHGFQSARETLMDLITAEFYYNFHIYTYLFLFSYYYYYFTLQYTLI